jgi:hypothetical protein
MRHCLLAAGLKKAQMIWRLSFVALLFASILTACNNRIEEKPCPITKNKSLSASRVTSETRPTEALSC